MLQVLLTLGVCYDIYRCYNLPDRSGYSSGASGHSSAPAGGMQVAPQQQSFAAPGLRVPPGWPAYITNLMASSSCIKKAAIVGANDGGVWARSDKPEFTASAEELKRFVDLFGDLENVPSKGFDLEGVHYVVPRTEPKLIFGKKEKTGVFAVKSNMAVVIAVYEGEQAMAQECRTAVEKMGLSIAGRAGNSSPLFVGTIGSPATSLAAVKGIHTRWALSQIAMALYLEQFVDSLSTVPAEVRRSLRLLRELDENSMKLMQQIDRDAKVYVRAARAMRPEGKAKSYDKIVSNLAEARTLCDDKIAVATQNYEMIDKHIRRLDVDLQRFEADIKKRLFGSKKELKAAAERAAAVNSGDESEEDGKEKKASKSSRKRKGDDTSTPSTSKTGKKRAKLAANTGTPSLAQSTSTAVAGGGAAAALETDKLAGLSGPALLQQLAGGDAHVVDMPVDPNEPTYCVCKQVSFGEMIGCDNDDCPIEWFHFECLGISTKPKGKWYCPQCTEMRKKKA